MLCNNKSKSLVGVLGMLSRTVMVVENGTRIKFFDASDLVRELLRVDLGQF